MRRFAVLLFVLAACGDPIDAGKEIAKECGAQKCPVGTMFREMRAVEGGYDIGAGFDPATYSAEGAFKRMGSGICEYACEVINACPDSTFPVISETCFTCAVIDSNNEVKQGDCG